MSQQQRAHGSVSEGSLPFRILDGGALAAPIDGSIDLLADIFGACYRDAGHDLDGSLGSVRELDRICHQVTAALRDPDLQPDQTHALAEEFIQGAGAYFGKLVIDHVGGSWHCDEDGQLRIVGLDVCLRPFHAAATMIRHADPTRSPCCQFTAMLTGICDQLPGSPSF